MANKKATVSGTSAKVSVDVVFMVDVTGSMGGFINKAKNVLANSIMNIDKVSSLIDAKYSLIVYRDHPPQDRSFASKILLDCGTSAELKAAMQTRYFHPDGGGDAPESGLDAINDINKLNLRDNSIRYGFLVGDAPLHGTPYGVNTAKCSCGLDANSVKTIVEQYNIEICGVNLSHAPQTTRSFQSVCKTVVEERTAPESIIVAQLQDICNNVEWSYDKLFPLLLADKFKATVDLAKDLGCTVKKVSSGIELLNTIGATSSF